ncbi:MAG: hypothetical protein JET69_05575 [Methanomassiliicoccales archaeon]|nr:hypothetical protein [Methanomassiliicoccales archaeon]
MDNDPVEAALAAVEKKEAAEYAARLNEHLDTLDSHVTMLRAMGVDVQVRVDAPEDRRKDSIEKVGSTKELGWKCYVDFLDEDGTQKRIDAAKRAATYAANGGA